MRKTKNNIILVVCFFSFFSFSLGLCKDPSILYLSYKDNPSQTIAIHWHTEINDQENLLFYKSESEENWHSDVSEDNDIQRFKVKVRTVHLKGLEPGMVYCFKIGEKAKQYKFRTLPDKGQKITFAVGGDAYRYLSLFRKMNEQVSKKNPDFVVMGGDIAYTHGILAFYKGKDWEMKRWQTFFQEWKKSMVTSDGRLIPIVPILGNHDIRKKKREDGTVEVRTPVLFFEFFAFPERCVSYRALDIGSSCSLFLLDTNHVFPIEGEQTAWLEQALQERQSVPVQMAVYHIGAFPSVYPYEGQTPRTIRRFWAPLFEKYHLDVAFEHHNHAYKRTFPIKEEKINNEGVVYIGDGTWGVFPRKAKNRWYLASKASKNCFNLVTLEGESYKVEAFDNKGKMIDSWQPHGAFAP
jgi:acid phosphatase type 7